MTKSITNYATATRIINEVNGVNRVVIRQCRQG
jgi:hypothetical protein